MVPQKHTEELAKEIPNLDLVQGYLVRKDADPNQPIQTRADSAVPGISYASMRVSVTPMDASFSSKPDAGSKHEESGGGNSSGGGSGGSKKGGSGKGESGKGGSVKGGSGKGGSSGKTK